MEDKNLDQDFDFGKLLETDDIKIPQAGDIIKAMVVTASKAEVKLDIAGVLMGVVRGPELYNEVPEYSELKPGDEVEAAVVDEENKIIFSEKDVWNKRQKPALDKYSVGMGVDGKITAITNFGVFVSFGEGIEGLIHISELAWQRIDSPSEMYKVNDEIKAEIISIDGAKVFLSAKKLLKDPWLEASAKYKAGQVVSGTILKVNPFGLFVKLDEEIHGLAHISQLNIGVKEKITDLFQADEVRDFEVVSVSQ